VQNDKQDDKEDNDYTDRDILPVMEISGLPITDNESLPRIIDHHT
jgi:hypothetical protein